MFYVYTIVASGGWIQTGYSSSPQCSVGNQVTQKSNFVCCSNDLTSDELVLSCPAENARYIKISSTNTALKICEVEISTSNDLAPSQSTSKEGVFMS